MTYKILLKQHIGVPDKPLIQLNDSVSPGTLLAIPAGLGAPIHSPVAGIVTEITDRYILISSDKTVDSVDEASIIPLEGNSEIDLISAAGIVGMGGAGFPTAIKCRTALENGYILVNAAECEPLLHHNIMQIEQNLEKTLTGLKILMKVCHAGKGIFAIKAKHEKALSKLKASCSSEPDISWHLLPDLYPMGEERAVVREVLGRLLAPTDLPSAANAVVINVETVLRVAEAVTQRRPCISKNISVTGKLKGGCHTRVFMDVPIGTSVGDLIERAGGIDGDYGEIIMGGPFTGHSVSLDEPVSKTTGGIIVTEPFEDLHQARLGLLLCACGANQTRMEELAHRMNGSVTLIQKCRQAVDVKGTLKCENPGNCPGQAQKCLNFKKEGCTDILIGNCSDCTNTVMGSAPKLGLTVHHQTDHVFDTVGRERMRYLTKSKKVEAGITTPTPPASGQMTQIIENGILKIDIKEGKEIHIELPF